MNLDMKLKFNFNKRNRYKNICSIEGCNNRACGKYCKYFHVENYSGTNFTDDLNDGEEFLYTTIRIKDDKEITFLCKYVKNKHIEVCPNCVFNNYLCYGLLCNIVILKVIKNEEMRNNK